MSLRSSMSQYGNYVSNWVQDYASVVLCPIPTGFQIGIWIPIGSLAITGMGGRGPKKRVSAAWAVALGGDRVDAMRIVHLPCSYSEEVRRLQAHVPALGAGAARCWPSVPSWAECPGRNYCAACSVLGGVPRVELLCCCASVPRRVLRT